ncbi:MAG TPA: glycosyltransferase [Bryobacteraceae bacterium]|nr:glycosyltransferase [Bryobacteraceae bacterium]
MNGATKTVLLVGSVDDEHNRVMKLCETYRSSGWTVLFWGMDRYKRRSRTCTNDGVRFEYLVRGYGESNWTLLIGYSIWFLRVFLKLLRARVDLVHVFELESALGVTLASVFRRVVYIYDVQDNYELRHNWPAPLLAAIRAADRWILKRAARLIVPDVSRITGVFSGFRDKAVIIPNCPPDDPEASGSVSDAESITHDLDLSRKPASPEPVRVLAMGHLAERRGVRLLLQAAAEVPGAKILMAGRFPEPDVQREALASERVEFLGWLDWRQAIGLGRRVDVIFTFYDPQFRVNRLANAQKWYDAMMTGTPVLVNSEVLASAWLAQAGVAYVCEYSKAGIVSALREIQADKAEARIRGRRARKLFECEFNWDIMRQKLLQAADSAVCGGAITQ